MTTEIAIQKDPTSSGQFWNPSSGDFDILPSNEARWQSTQGTAADWEASGASTPTWVNNTEYGINVRTTDLAGNQSAVVSSTFTFDNELPVAQIGRPIQNNFYRQVTSLTGTATDNQTLNNLQGQ